MVGMSPIVRARAALANFEPVSSKPLFESFVAQQVDDKVFPPRVGVLEVRRPRMPEHMEGPAPVVYGSAPAAPETRGLAQIESLWMVAQLDATHHKVGSASASLSTGIKASSRPASSRRTGRGKRVTDGLRDAEGEAQQTDFLAASSEFQRLLAMVTEAHYEEQRASLSVSAATQHKLKHNPLTVENQRIRLALRRGGKRTSDDSSVAMRSSGMDRLLLIQRLHVQAAIVLQRWRRRELRRRFWVRFCVEMRAVVLLQVRATAACTATAPSHVCAKVDVDREFACTCKCRESGEATWSGRS